MRFKTLCAVSFIAMMLLINMTVAGLDLPLYSHQNGNLSGKKDNQTTQSTADASSSLNSNSASGTGYSQAESDQVEFKVPNVFDFRSFLSDLQSQKADKWHNLATFDEDSAEVVIGLDDARSEGYATVNNLIIENGGRLIDTVSLKGNLALVADIPIYSVSSFVTNVQNSNLARYVEPNMKFQVGYVPNDPYWTNQWGPQKIQADYAWNTTFGDPAVLVAVIDTGIDYNHEDLAANYVPLGYDWVNRDADPMDDMGHGTHCAGIIAAQLDNNAGIAGVAQVKIMAEKGLDAGGYGNENDLAQAIAHAADQGARILSNSWGGPESQLIYDAIKYAYDNGVLVVAAAGNSASSTKHYPAAYDEVVAVTATDRDDSPASFTTFGDWVEVAAPGVDIYSTISSQHDPRFNYPYDYLSGTSMACPHVSATAALIWSAFPNATRDWVTAQLEFTADDLGEPGFDQYYGYGRINAKRAVEQAPQEHDLLISHLERPKSVQPKDTVSFNLTVMNFGLNEEANVPVQLLVDGVLTDSELIGVSPGYTERVKLLWTPMAEGTYNVTLYVVPVPNETAIENNVVSKMYLVRYFIPVLWDDVHDADGDSLTGNYLMLDDLLTANGFRVDELTTGTINSGLLAQYDILVLIDPEMGFLPSEITDIHDWVASGGALVIIPDSGYPPTLNQIMAPYSAQLTGLSTWYGSATNIAGHPITEDVKSIYYDLAWQLQVTSPGEALAWSQEGYAFLSVTGENVVILSDSNIMDNYGLVMDDNTQLMQNIFDWIGVEYEHELTARLDAPSYLVPGDSTLLNATVYNRGLSTESNVELFLMINGSVVNSATIPELANRSSHTIDYFWTPPGLGTYNITAYVPPVPGEIMTTNNVRTKYLYVRNPLINPVEGQWAYYTEKVFDSSGQVIRVGYYNFTYVRYVEPYKIYVEMWYKDPSGYNMTGGMVVSTMDRYVESGVWAGLWYPGWIETGVSIGSTINLLYGKATVNGSRMIPVGIYPIDCWEIPAEMPGIVYDTLYDKMSGLWIGMDYGIPGYQRFEMRLTETSVPIGTPYEHELAVTLEAPDYLEPNDSRLLNATVYNIGLNTENNVALSIMINGTAVESVVISTLPNGTSYTLSYLWTPTLEAKYNVTAYAEPVPGEIVTENNAATKIVPVRVVKGYILFDQTHFTDNVLYYYSMLVRSLRDRGYVVDTLLETPITLSRLERYDLFVVPQAHSSYSTDELASIQEFVLKGGGLFVIGDDAPYIYTDLTRFAGITWEYGGYSGITTDITPHPVTEGVAQILLGSPSSRLMVSLSAKDIVRDVARNNMIAVSEVGHGAVLALADEDTVNDWSISAVDNLRLANNIFDWLNSRRPVASFDYTPLDPYVGEVITFDASASYDPDGTVVGYLWDFGDGALSEGVVTTHTYTAGGVYTVAFTAIDNEGLNNTCKVDVTVARTSLNIEVEVGSIHFNGEIAEFYLLVSSMGNPIDAEIAASLYYNGAMYDDLSDHAETISSGFYRITYNIPADASPGTYALLVEARYLTLGGVSMGSFLLSPTLSGWNSLLIGIDGNVGTLKTDLGLIAVDITAINAKLVSIEGDMATMDSTLGVISTYVDAIHAEIEAIDGTLVEVQSDIGKITTDISSIQLQVTAINGDVATIETTLGTLSGTLTSIEDEIVTIKTDIGDIKVILQKLPFRVKSVMPSGNLEVLVVTTSTIDGQVVFSNNVLSVDLSGPAGTTGTLKVVVPKQLLNSVGSSIDRVVATIDDVQVVFSYREQTDGYLVSLIYPHSTHTVKIYLEGLLPTLPQWTLYIVAAAIAVVAVGAAVGTHVLRARRSKSVRQK